MVLSAFFWGYMMTQVLGGYVSDRVGGERVMLVASVLWSSVTLCTPWLIQMSAYTSHSLYFVVPFRILLGVSQGMTYKFHLSFLNYSLLFCFSAAKFFKVLKSFSFVFFCQFVQ